MEIDSVWRPAVCARREPRGTILVLPNSCTWHRLRASVVNRSSGEDAMSEPDFENRTVLVTGGSRGIGRACCQRLARAGARVAINFRSREDDALETAKLVEAAGARAMIVQADVADQKSVETDGRRGE